ncbi:MAG: ABC transporter permease [Oscillospiraceae bacterium]|nr:ABC transporter permease [Oscillospiraceae bacterium]
MSMFYFIAQSTMFFMIPLLIVALGGMFSERSGVVNIALEGKMVMGAFAGVMFLNIFQTPYTSHGILLVALLVAMVTGMMLAILHAFASINLKANQVISGIAINMFAPAFAIYVAMFYLDAQHIPFLNQFRIDSVPILGSIPFLGPLLFQNTYITTFLGYLIFGASAFVLYKTKFGLRLRSCGEHPQAADSVGISVAKMRYAGVLISGALAGMGGMIWAIPIGRFGGDVQGYGFLALAVLIFGAWRPKRILFAALFFAILQTIAVSFSAIPFLFNLGIPGAFYSMMPYVATLILLIFTSKNTQAPRAVGQPYDKGGR